MALLRARMDEERADATLLRSEPMVVREEADLAMVRHLVRERGRTRFRPPRRDEAPDGSQRLGRNMLIHGGGGTMLLETFTKEGLRGVRLTFEDRGPGIADLEQAMGDGFTTKGGMGLGLGGSKRLVHEFEVASRVGEGTRVTVTQWT